MNNKSMIDPDQKPWRFWKRENKESIPEQKDEDFYRAGQWQLVWWKFKRHKLANIGMIVLAVFYFFAIFAGFMAPYDPLHRFKDYVTMAPSDIHLWDTEGKFHGPFVYGILRDRDPVTFRPVYVEDTEVIYPIKLFVRGDEYEFLGLFTTDLHFFGTEDPEMPVFLLGSDLIGRDIFSRVVYGGRISLTIGLIGVALSFILGMLLGGAAGYFGGVVDEAVMRVIDVMYALPAIPLWMSLAAALPQDWPQIRTYFFVTIILSVLGWTGLARTVRGKMLSLREEDYIMAAKLDGENEWRIISRYMLPGFLSYIIVQMTLVIPGMILAETSLSFLGIGLQEPTVSWGVMLGDTQEIKAIAQTPWLLWPVVFVIVAVLMFNFLGDGMRDAADPYVT